MNHPTHNSIISKQYGSTHTQETGFNSFHAMWNYNCMKLASWNQFLLCLWHPWSNYSWNSSSPWAMPQQWRTNTELVISAATNYMSWHNSIRCLLLKYILKNNLTLTGLCHATSYVTLQYWKHSCVTKEKNYVIVGDKQEGMGEENKRKWEVICQGPSKRNTENETNQWSNKINKYIF